MYDFIFRLDATESTGAGHFQRVFALIQRLASHSYKMACVGDISPIFNRLLLSYEVPVYPVGKSKTCRCLVLDHYADFELLFSQGLQFSKLMVIEDLDQRASSGPDLVLNALGDQSSLQARYPSAKVLTGIEYLVFRQALSQLKRQVCSENKTLSTQKILVSLGGTDQSKLIIRICAVLKAIQESRRQQLGKGLDVTVLSAVAVQVPETIQFKLGFDPDFLNTASSYDLVICGAGQTFLELSYLGLDPIGLVLAENQQACAELLSNFGAMTLSAHADFETELLELIQARLNTGMRRAPALTELMASASDKVISNMVALLR